MWLPAWHRRRGDLVHKIPQPGQCEPLDRVYASTVFEFSNKRVAELKAVYPEAVIGGTGLGPAGAGITVESAVGEEAAIVACSCETFSRRRDRIGKEDSRRHRMEQ